MVVLQGECHVPVMETFEDDEEFEEEVLKAFVKAKMGKGTSGVECFVEAFQAKPEEFAKITSTNRDTCGRLQYVLQAWMTAIKVPISKKRDRSEPESYRSIAL